MNIARFLGVYFVIMTSNFVARFFLRKKGIERGKIGIINKLIIASLPFFLFQMWNDNMIPIDIKIINTLIACCSIGAAIAYLYIAWKGNGKTRKMIQNEPRK